MREELKEKDFVVDRLWKAAKTRKHGGGGQGWGPGEGTKRRSTRFVCQESTKGFPRALYDRILKSSKLETSELCPDWESVARSQNNRSETIEENGEESVFVAAEKEMVPRCLLQLSSEKRPCTPVTVQGCDEFLKYVEESKVL